MIHESKEELTRLLSKLLDEGLAEEEHARLEEMLLDDPEARQLYMRWIDLQVELECTLLPPRQCMPVPPAPTASSTMRGWKWAAAALVLLGVGSALFFWLRPPGEDSWPLAKIETITGKALVIRGGQELSLSPGGSVQPGDTLELQGDVSRAEVVHGDGARLTLVGPTLVVYPEEGEAPVLVRKGNVTVETSKPFAVATRTAEVRVLGTVFSVEVAPERTSIRVDEGQVQVTRASDRQVLVVDEGERVIVEKVNDLISKPILLPPAEWDIDFEQGLPAGGTHGEYVTQGLPPGSRGGVGAQRMVWRETVYHAVGLQVQWIDGLFSVREASHLHIKYRMNNPDWLTLVILTRQANSVQGPGQLYLFRCMLHADIREHPWQTITIPLSSFQRDKDGTPVPQPPGATEAVVGLMVVAEEPDRGLVVDRIWVTRGGPGGVRHQGMK